MREVFERFLALDGMRVSLAIIRAKDLIGVPVVRFGLLRLAVPTDGVRGALEARRDVPVAHVLDELDLPIATLAGNDTFVVSSATLQCAARPAFRIDVALADAAQHADVAHASTAGTPIDYERATQEVAAELEAGFRSALRFRPDPAPDASVRARYGVAPIEAGPLHDGSVRFAVDHASATLHPAGESALRLTCVESTIRANRQSVATFEPVRGERYALESSDIGRLAADVRAFLAGRRERFAIKSR